MAERKKKEQQKEEKHKTMKAQSKQNRTRVLAESAVMVALAAVLSMFPIYQAPLGGTVTLFSMAPILLLSLRHGTRVGILGAFAYSITQLLLGLGTIAYVPTFAGIAVCAFLDYILAFTCIGTAGFFRFESGMDRKKKLISTAVGTLTVCVLRFLCHLLSGAVVWYEITKAGDWNEYVHQVGMWLYSLVYNLQYMVPETVLLLVAVPAMVTVLDLVPKMKKRGA
ncbi:MAG: energy-coupled thiamine transporter ThiT [Ruminococcaceae bacterium]|nr:energy-coupled thiamine transporter ThiT [Oscillospiraceae bacterium]